MMNTNTAPILVAGTWRASQKVGEFQPDNPALGAPLPQKYPLSSREEALNMLQAGGEAAEALRSTSGAKIAEFLEAFAAGIERRAAELVEMANLETALPKSPRLKDVELPRVSGETFLKHPHELQTEAFGPVGLFVLSRDIAGTATILKHLEGNLTGTIYSDTTGKDDADYEIIEPHLRQRVGRLINDRMPTGVAVSPAMNHGGPFPATDHPGFTAVGLPASIQRFTVLQCYDNVRPGRLPAGLESYFFGGQSRRQN
jgi:acyl-CoA reductase-like NAD-dependent aldehyde dehydrogenase